MAVHIWGKRARERGRERTSISSSSSIDRDSENVTLGYHFHRGPLSCIHNDGILRICLQEARAINCVRCFRYNKTLYVAQLINQNRKIGGTAMAGKKRRINIHRNWFFGCKPNRSMSGTHDTNTTNKHEKKKHKHTSLYMNPGMHAGQIVCFAL